MPEVNITHTEITPSHTEGAGGGRRGLSHTELNPSFLGGGGGGWRVFSHTEQNPTYKTPKDTQTMGRTKGFDFRGKGFRI